MKKRLLWLVFGASALLLCAATDVTIVTRTLIDSLGNTVLWSNGTSIIRRIAGTDIATLVAAGETLPGLVISNASGTPGATPAPGIVYSNADVRMASGKNVIESLPVVTPVTSFPTPGGSTLAMGAKSRVVTGAPTANYVPLPAATANIGRTGTLMNGSANPVALVPENSDKCNAATANTPCACAANKICECTATASGLWQCGSK